MLLKAGVMAKPVFGGVLVAMSGAVILGVDRTIESGTLNLLPSWWVDLITRL